jgi:vancomycin resistance protein YoaR
MGGGPAEPPPDNPDESDARWWRRRPVVIGGVVVGLLVLLYFGDLILSTTAVPRGVAVAGVEIGGMSRPEAEQTLRSRLGDRLVRPVALQAGTVSGSLDPRAAGLSIDWRGTIDRAGEQPFNPWTRLTSLFTTHNVDPVSTANQFTLRQAAQAARPQLERPTQEGTIRFDGANPVAVPSQPGQTVDPNAVVEAVADHWLDPTPVTIPVTTTPTSVTPEGLQSALDGVARPAVAGPVTVVGEGKNATITPEQIGGLLTFRPDGSGGLAPGIDHDAAVRAVRPQLASTETKGKDATFAFEGDAATVVPSAVGHTIDYQQTLSSLMEVLNRPPGPPPAVFTPGPSPPGIPPLAAPPVDGRAVNAVYTTTPPKVTTEQLNALGPATVIGEFQTGGFAADSGQNIKRVAEQVNGAVIAPGSVFSLNGYTGPREAPQGYVDAGIIEDGVPGRGIGGGISQFATTLYNASYFAGLEDVEHKEHSYYISRYPAGREATVFEGAIDLKFRNDGPSPVLIRTTWTPSSIKVQLYGQKRYDVTSDAGPRTDNVAPGTKDLGTNPKCKPSKGVPGFRITVTRNLKDVRSGETHSEPRTVRYEPEPQITCNDR